MRALGFTLAILVVGACGPSGGAPVSSAPPPRTGPREPAPPSAGETIEDAPFIQEINHRELAGLTNPAIAVLPPMFGFDGPLAVETRRIVTQTSTALALAPGESDFIDAVAADDAIYALTAEKLFRLDASGTWSSTTAHTSKLVIGRGLLLDALAAASSDDFLYVATSSAVTKLDAAAQVVWHLALPPSFGAPTALITAVSLPEPLELVVFSGQRVAAVVDGAWKPIDLFGLNRVPYLHTRRAIRLADGGFLAVTPEGAMRVLDRGNGPEWRVYNADRWIRSKDVRGAAQQGDRLWLATAAGISEIEARTMTLEEKFADFVSRIEQRHDRDGAVADSHLTVRGDLSSNIPWDSDNDGSWTSYWLRAECLRWKVTGDEGAHANFTKALDAMLRLRDLTGTDYFLARAVIRKEGCRLDDCDAPDDGSWFTSPDGAWWVKQDTSNDEVIAHIGMMGHAYDHCADDAQRVRVRAHIAGIIGGIVDHGYQLVDLDGLVTTYGQFDPQYVKESIPGTFGDGGLRAAQILAGLTIAYYLTGDARFYSAKRELIDEYHYDDEAAGELERPGRRAQMDNDEMGVWSFNVLLRYEEDEALYEKWRAAWASEWSSKFANEQAAWWDVVHATNGGPELEVARVRGWLRSAPVDMIRWNMSNSARQDLVPPPAPYFEQNGRMRFDGSIVPYDERPTNRWNTDSFHTEGGLDGWVEMDGADVLAPYWMARFYGWVVMPRRAN